MNKRYIDFVPAKKTAKSASKNTLKSASKNTPKNTPKKQGVNRGAVVQKSTGKVVTRPVGKPVGKVVMRSVVKPTGKVVTRKASSSTSELKKIKSRKLVGSKSQVVIPKKPAVKVPAIKTIEKATDSKNKGVFTPPKPTFINQNKVVKRPLSGNVYRKKVVTAVAAEEPKGPVTIISKPEKDKHVGVIVTIIITIILGAAAGTVAFLLLPK